MDSVTVHYSNGESEVVESPEFIDCLFNINELAIDGDRFTNVEQVTYTDK